MTPRALVSRIKRLRTVPSQVSKAFSEYVFADLRKSFDAQQTPEGAAWPSYAQSSVARGRVPPLLVDNIGRLGRTPGQLRGSLVVTPKQSAGVLAQYTDQLARVHHKGGGSLPARPLMPRRVPRRWLDTLRDMLTRKGAEVAAGG